MKIFLLSLISLALISPALAKEHRAGSKRHREGPFSQLDLTKEQKQKIKEIRKSRKENMQVLKSKKLSAREEFQEALGSEASSSKLKSLHKNLLKTNEEFKKYKFETLLKTREILNKDQRKKFGELKKKHRRKRRHRKSELDEEEDD